jgi:hypothetical protein
MIYEIANKDLYTAIVKGATMVCLSGDGTCALVSSTTLPTGIDIINQFDETIPNSTELSTLLALPFWRQPCKDCDI